MITLENYKQVRTFVKEKPTGIYEVEYTKKLIGLLRQAAFHNCRSLSIRREKDLKEGEVIEVALFSGKENNYD